MSGSKIKFKDTPGELAFRHQLISLLGGPREHTAKGWEKLVRSWKKAFLALGSETPDNLDCTKRVDYGQLSPKFHQTKGLQGLRIRGTRIPFATIASSVEGIEIPKVIADEFPDVTQAQWDAFLRVVTMIFIALEHPHQTRKRTRKKPKA